MLPEYDSEPLNLPLNFTHTEKANRKPSAELLRVGDYTAIEVRTYLTLQKCHGCGVAEKAKNLIVIKDQVSGDTFEIGYKCMHDLYGVDTALVTSHSAQVSRARRQLGQKLNLRGTTEQLIQIVREAILTYVPVPERFLREIDSLDIWQLSTADSNRIRDLHQFACYYRDWQEQPSIAQARWKALRAHPAFAYDAHRDDVSRKCSRALEAHELLPEHDILALNNYLRKAAAHQSRLTTLVTPDRYPDEESYVDALTNTVQEAANGSHGITAVLSGTGEGRQFNPTKYVSLQAKSLYSTVAVWHDEAENIIDKIRDVDEYRTRTRKAIYAIGPVEIQEYPERRATRRNRDNELEEFVVEPAYRFIYRRVSWALQERYTETYPLWHRFGQDKLARYS